MTTNPILDVASEEDLPVGSATAVNVGGFAIAVFNVDRELFAIDDVCIRCGASLADGMPCGHHVTCRQCGWRYDVATGAVCALGTLAVDRYRVIIEDGRITVDARPLR